MYLKWYKESRIKMLAENLFYTFFFVRGYLYFSIEYVSYTGKRYVVVE
jgi:hypothetical protein